MILDSGEWLFNWPLAKHVITAGWFYSDGSAHRALDFRAAVGTPVFGVAGMVDWVQTWDGKTKTGNQSYGNLVRIRCNAKYKGEHKCQTPHVTEEEIKVWFLSAINQLLSNRDEIIANTELLIDMAKDTSPLENKIDDLEQ